MSISGNRLINESSDPAGYLGRANHVGPLGYISDVLPGEEPWRPKVAVLVDRVDPDNTLCVDLALNEWQDLDVVAVFVTGRPAHSNPNAPMHEWEPDYAEKILRLNTELLKGYLVETGHEDLPVFTGSIAPNTIVPHSIHIDEHDFTGPRAPADGDLKDGIQYLKSHTEGVLNLIVGGPMTDVVELMDDPDIEPRLGPLVAQFGVNAPRETVYDVNLYRSFNAAADPYKSIRAMALYPSDMILIPKDITRADRAAIDSVDTLRGMGINERIIEDYEVFLHHRPREDNRIYPHDMHPTFLMADLLRAPEYVVDGGEPTGWIGDYYVEPIKSYRFEFTEDGPEPLELGLNSGRYKVTQCDYGAVFQHLARQRFKPLA